MKPLAFVPILPLSLVLLPLAACGQTSSSSGAQVLDYAILVDRLRAAGATVEAQGAAGGAFGLHGQGRAMLVNGARVQIYEYNTASASEADAQHISAGGTTFRWQGLFGIFGHSVMVTFIALPHWYKGGRILVLYVGSDTAIEALLVQQLGQPFAGWKHF